jgi:hypothetical protein
MKMNATNRIARIAATAGLSILVATAVCPSVPADSSANSPSGQPQNRLKHRQEMMAMREKMLARAKAEDAALAKMVAEMNQAPEAKKVDLETAILTKLVAQHHQMLSEWEAMHARMQHLGNAHARAPKPALHGAASGETAATSQ